MPPASTAQQLLEYRAELRAGGIDPDLADVLVRDAASVLVQQSGLVTKPLPSAVITSTVPESEAGRGVGESKSPA
ncbi:hypothetical protein [Streptomyces sp. NPDC051636]|uniref:hypothetical protein n=1 Tax=Streptomyces sp. NPDC051636 TaxID=3365663 RepID=UPI0037A40E44